jgi:Domain of unknown function (DUF4276)
MDHGRNWRDTMVKDVKIYIEGGGDSKEERVRLREGFRKLFEKTIPEYRMPRTVASGGREEAFKDFKTGLKTKNQFSLLLVDSEDQVDNISDEIEGDFAWKHLTKRDGWIQPEATQNHQAMLMATCMEAWIATDKETLKKFYPTGFQVSALPSLVNIESKNRHEIHENLVHATRNCVNKTYKKGVHSFELIGKLNPDVLKANTTQFRRLEAILRKVMKKQ